MSWAALLLAASLLLRSPGSGVRLEAGLPRRGARQAGVRAEDPLGAASTLDVLAACLRSGMAVSTAAAAVAATAPEPMAALLRRAADLLALGADPAHAWDTPAGSQPAHIEAFLRMARRSAASGAALAHGVEDLATQLRGAAADTAAAKAERASVLIAGPLGLCYLPAFLCLGIVPVVIGLAGDVLQTGVL
ncbi:type II secretion system F family protein [Mycobacterium sp. SMC-4]|uniref:type II secretion system F family protein n=1 Tax=Mycobacterium sp. SMC-4 TaxID=2857059 RepID=UPI0021B2FD60|nr:type II secretion system F family protein [Mycobacterium sp. SMC-4]UXA17664.1 type II secretion system F family protein [Mycobacterium sp. SMC-4]